MKAGWSDDAYMIALDPLKAPSRRTTTAMMPQSTFLFPASYEARLWHRRLENIVLNPYPEPLK